MTTTRTGSVALQRRLFWTANFVVGGLCLATTAGSFARERRTSGGGAVGESQVEPFVASPPTFQQNVPPPCSARRRLPRIERTQWGSPDPARQAPLALAYKDADETLYSRLPNQVNSLSRRANVVWLGTRGGARRIETGSDGFTPLRMRHFFQKDGLPSNNVVAISGDADGGAWCVARASNERYGDGTAHLCRFDAQRNRWHTLRSLFLPRPAQPDFGVSWPYANVLGRGNPAIVVTERRVFFTLGVLGMPEAGSEAALLIYDKTEHAWRDAAWDVAALNSDYEAPARPPAPPPSTRAAWERSEARRRSLPTRGGFSPAYPSVNALVALTTGATGADRVYLATSGGLLRFDIGGARSRGRWRHFLSDQAFLLAAAADPGVLYLVGRPLPTPGVAAERATDGGGWHLSRFDTRTGEARDWPLPIGTPPAPGFFSDPFDLLRTVPQSVAVASDGSVWVTAGRNDRDAPFFGTRFWVFDPPTKRLRTFQTGSPFDARPRQREARLWERVPDDVLLPLVAHAAERDFGAPFVTQEALDRVRDWFLVAPLPDTLSRTYWMGTGRIEEEPARPGSPNVTWTVGWRTEKSPAASLLRSDAAGGGEQHFTIPFLRPDVTGQDLQALAATRAALWATGRAYHPVSQNGSGGSTEFVARLERADKTVRLFGPAEGLIVEHGFVTSLVSDGETVWAVTTQNVLYLDPRTDRFADVSNAIAPLLPGWDLKNENVVPAVGDLVADFGAGGSRDDPVTQSQRGAAARAQFVWALVSGSRLRSSQNYSGPPLPDVVALARYDVAERTWKMFTPPAPLAPPVGGMRGTWLRVEKDAAYVATNVGVLRLDRARQTWRTLVPPHLPRTPSQGGDYISRLTRDPRAPDALYLVSPEWVLRCKER